MVAGDRTPRRHDRLTPVASGRVPRLATRPLRVWLVPPDLGTHPSDRRACGAALLRPHDGQAQCGGFVLNPAPGIVAGLESAHCRSARGRILTQERADHPVVLFLNPGAQRSAWWCHWILRLRTCSMPTSPGVV